MSALRFSRPGRALAAFAAAAVLTSSVVPVASAAPAPALVSDPVGLVNTFIGSKDDGNTFPGASMPFGKTQISPIGSHYSGWRYDDPKIHGFGHLFLSGAGCWEQGGVLSVLPTTGSVGPGPQNSFDTTVPATFDHHRYGAQYTHAGEVGTAGYYKTRLTSYGGIDAETTASTRTGAERYTFTDASNANVFVNLGQANDKHNVTSSSVKVVGDRTLEGSIETLSFCGGRRYTTWFTTTFDQPFSGFGTWSPQGGQPGSRESSGGAGLRGAWLNFGALKGKSVTATTAVSHVDIEGARKNLAAEGLRRDGRPLGFDELRARAEQAWRAELSRVRIGGGSRDDLVVFYTALYHVLLQPLTGNDHDGRYRGFDDKIHMARGWTYYEYYSLWDTYRTQNQLVAMFWPSRAKDIAQSLLAVHQQGGWLPRWAYASFETNTMTGDPVTPYMVDLWRFGAYKGKEREALAALLQNANGVPPAASQFQGRAGNPNYLANGFVEYDKQKPKKGMDIDQHHGGSATMEYALADCSLSIMAGALGASTEATALRQRGQSWRNVWDATVADRGFTGFPRPKVLGGAWHSDPGKPYTPTSDHGFHEGTAWQYQWLVQQDVSGALKAMGGKEETGKRLDTFFAYDKLLANHTEAVRKEWVVGPYAYYNQFRYNPNNEPDLHAPWMYTLIGQPWKTSTVTRAAQTLFTNAPNGVTGNDDLGTMSAWYVFSALGMYPAVNGTGQLVLSKPRFPLASIQLENGRPLVIAAPGVDPAKNQFIGSARLGARPHDKVWVDWDQLSRGQVLTYALTEQVPAWGTGATALPTSPCGS
ncbi:GH92 family glycosyl hydrolase [Allokutzneria multivorans]|uniref:GH92 family glycosyl hydrolase n=1 Tax=Allokutzneria multivorans TaxID=1142134 RepID=UPI0031E8C67A